MEGEAGVLQHRVEAVAVERRRHQARGTGSEVNRMNSRKPAPIMPCTASTRARERRRQIVAEQRDRGAEQRQDQHPEHHRALVVAPDAGDLVEQRLGRVAVLDDIEHREIRGDVGVDQRREGEARSARTAPAPWRCADRHQPASRARRAAQRHARCTSASSSARTSAKWPSLDDHRAASSSRSASGVGIAPLAVPVAGFFSASATSGGMYFSSCLARTLVGAEAAVGVAACPRPRRPGLRGTDRAARRV